MNADEPAKMCMGCGHFAHVGTCAALTGAGNWVCHCRRAPCPGAEGLTCYAGMLYPTSGSAYACPTCKPEWAPIPSGEVETPCATCEGEGFGEQFGPWSDDLQGFPPCPDCAVETPEAAVEARAIEAMTEAARVHVGHFDDGDKHWACDCGKASGHDLDSYVRHVNASALPALIAQGWTPPGGEDTK